MAVLDGIRVIEDLELNGKLELKYISENGNELLNNRENEYLHDIYNSLTNQE